MMIGSFLYPQKIANRKCIKALDNEKDVQSDGCSTDEGPDGTL